MENPVIGEGTAGLGFGKTILKTEFVDLIRCCEDSVYCLHIRVKTGCFLLVGPKILFKLGSITISYLK